MAGSLGERLRREIDQQGPIPVSRFVDAALYDPDDGFYMTEGRAGRSGDFLTGPEVGPLFGAVIARAVDDWWREAGEPERFAVFEWGAGPGTLARAVLAAAPAVLAADALRWCAIEISARQRAMHPEHRAIVSAPDDDAARAALGLAAAPAQVPRVVIANELLDNLPFDVYERTADGWCEHRVDVAPGERGFVVTRAPADADVEVLLHRLAPAAAPGDTVPWQPAGRRWVAAAIASSVGGRVVVIDYGAPTATLATRGGWCRTHRAHADNRDWLAAPGECDITADVATDQIQLEHRGRECTQAEFLRRHGIDDLVAQGRRAWEESAHVGDLAALTMRSRIREADALLDPSGMGSFTVLEWATGAASPPAR